MPMCKFAARFYPPHCNSSCTPTKTNKNKQKHKRELKGKHMVERRR